MKKIFGIILLFSISTFLYSQEFSVQNKRLEFLIGEWRSESKNLKTMEGSTGRSLIQWILGETWLQWKFESETNKGLVEVLTLINYDTNEDRYAFYSFNSIDEELLPHFGNWINDTILQLEIIENGKKVVIDIVAQGDDSFEQQHSTITDTGEKIPTRKTRYFRLKE